MFLLAAVENACRQVARAGGVWADALLTSLSPLTYERGDYSDGTEKLDPDWEPTSHPSGVEAPTPPEGFKLPMFKASDLIEIAAEYVDSHRRIEDRIAERFGRLEWCCNCGIRDLTAGAHAKHVAELAVSELVHYLTGLAYDQSHPETPQ